MDRHTADAIVAEWVVADDHHVEHHAARPDVHQRPVVRAVLAGVGNGDPHCHEPDKGENRSAFHGLARAIVQAGAARQAGDIVLRATAEGLAPAALTVTAVPAQRTTRAMTTRLEGRSFKSSAATAVTTWPNSASSSGST